MREAGLLTAVAVGLMFWLAATGILLLGGRLPRHQLGERLDQPLLARVAFDAPGPAHPGKVLRFEAGQPIATDPVDERDLPLIQAEHKQFIASGGAGSLILHILGLAGVALLVTAGLWLYAAYYQPNILRHTRRCLGLAGLLLCVLLVGRLAELAGWQIEVRHLVATAVALLAAMVLCIAYSRRFALGAGWFLALLLVLAVRQGYPFLVVLLTGLATVSLSLDEIRSRSKLVAVGLTASVLMALAAVSVGLIGGLWTATIPQQAIGMGLAGLAAGLLMQGLLPVAERVCGIATAMTLLEYSDVNKPLLRRLAAEAPGTFSHSLLLGTMAEAAAEAIEANGLLARVGAYHHDIGKINKPGYFVENQEGTFSRHAKLSPAMSLLIILGHVKDGLESAKEYNLPQVIHPFIAEHHGTTLVEYFYHAAAKQRTGQEPPAEAQFRYPGPKPQSKETAILMLCDSVEGATRALAEPTPARIEDIVHEVARKRLHDGQLDECNLTLRELHIVEQSLVKSLWGFYHGRIAYPSSPEKPAGAKTA